MIGHFLLFRFMVFVLPRGLVRVVISSAYMC